ncbi:fungal-specific transcription factor domain-containing protein [Fusarium oxysporum]|nr:fungal-specific transcription factor domain-containing protein [Fusarium oxysporum]
MGSQRTNPNGCHNCRRKRFRCDGSVPSCRKCISLGKECLGYGTLWRWTDSVASRGKLAGKKLPCNNDNPDHSSSSQTDADASRLTINIANQCISSNHCLDLDLDDSIQLYGNLTDPLFSDMSSSDHNYLSYFADGLCPQLVAIDLPGHNPFPRLLPMGFCNPVLQYTMITAAALHMSNVLRPDTEKRPVTLNHVNNNWEPSRRAMLDALAAKQKALYLLRMAFQDLDTHGRDMVLTAAMLLVTADMIDSGKHGSKAHLDGIGWLLSYAQPATSVSEMLKDFVISDCYIFYVFALTFMDQIPQSSLALNTTIASSAIHYAARNSFICCPAEVLQILWSTAMILQRHTANYDDMEGAAAKGYELFMQAMAFNVETWSRDIQQVPLGRQVTDIPSRIHTGYTHQMACCLYIMYAIPSVRSFLPENTEQDLEHGLIFHLHHITDEDPNFKTSFWPTFIAGAQTSDHGQQAWIMDRMRRQSRLFPWGFLYTAMETLELIWRERAKAPNGLNWLEILRSPEVSFLIV